MPEKKKKRKRLSAETKKKYEANLASANEARLANSQKKKEMEQNMKEADIPVNERKFADLYVWGDAGIQGKPGRCYAEVFGIENSSNAGTLARKLLAKPYIDKYIDKQMKEFELLLKAEKLKNMVTLTKIRDEMADAEYVNRFGEINGVPACRSVAIKATETINNMLGFEKPKEVNINGGDSGVTFNLIAPTAEP